MILDLRPYEDFPVNVQTTYEKPGFTIEREDLIEIISVATELSIQYSDDEYFCQGTITGRLVLECARCLKHYETDVTGKTDFIVRSAGPVDPDLADVPDDEEYAEMVDKQQADITTIARQTVGLAIAIKPVCDESCQGLCSQCGVNKNEKECKCDTDKIDERWDGLRGLSQK